MSQGKKLTSNFWNKTFLEALKRNCGVVTHASKEVGVAPQTYYDYRSQNKVFAKKVDSIKEDVCLPLLEDIVFARAIKGNDKLLLFLLRNLGGKKWNRDKAEEAMAKEEPFVRRREESERYKEEQRPPTKAEKAAAAAYLAVLDQEE